MAIADPLVATDGVRAESPGPTPVREGRMRSLWHRSTSTWWRRVAWAAGALVVAAAIVATVVVLSAPRPDATLHATADHAGDDLIRMVTGEVIDLEIDSSTLTSYGSYLGLEIWSVVNAFGSPCLLAVYRGSILSEVRCAPPAAALIMDVSSSGDGFEGFDGVAGVGIIRFIHRGETVDAYVHLLPGTS